MSKIKFEIVNALNNSNYEYKLYEDNKEVQTGTAGYTDWDEDAEKQSAWVKAIKKYNKSKKISTEVSELKQSIKEIREKLNISGDNLPLTLDVELPSIVTSLSEIATITTYITQFVSVVEEWKDWIVKSAAIGVLASTATSVVSATVQTVKSNALENAKNTADDIKNAETDEDVKNSAKTNSNDLINSAKETGSEVLNSAKEFATDLLNNLEEELETKLENAENMVIDTTGNLYRLLDNLICACRKGPTQLKDAIVNLYNVNKTNAITFAKNTAQNYMNIVGKFAEPVLSQVNEYADTIEGYRKNEEALEAAMERMRKEYAEEINSFKVSMVEGESFTIAQVPVESNTNNSSDESEDDDDYDYGDDDSFYENLTPGSNQNLPKDIFNLGRTVFKGRFSQKTVLDTGTKTRYKKCLNEIVKEVFEQKHIPIHFTVLLITESGAMSPSGDWKVENGATAKGPWQIIRSVGQQYGLIKGGQDYRNDLSKSTNVAATSLTSWINHCKKYKCPIGFADMAYSAGWAGVQNIQAQTKKLGKNPKDLYDMIRASRNYGGYNETSEHTALLLYICTLLGYDIETLLKIPG
jgi:hypothetical protein